MRAFVLRARSAPTDSKLLIASVGQDAHTRDIGSRFNECYFCSAVAS